MCPDSDKKEIGSSLVVCGEDILVKTQLKSVLFSQQSSSNLETFLKNLLKTLHARAEKLKETIHLGEQYDFRECSRPVGGKQKAAEKAKTGGARTMASARHFFKSTRQERRYLFSSYPKS